jgi:hypothetical protein
VDLAGDGGALAPTAEEPDQEAAPTEPAVEEASPGDSTLVAPPPETSTGQQQPAPQS